MSVIAVVGLKGGISKTTTAVLVACEIQSRGKRVLLVDADRLQASAYEWSRDALALKQCPPTVLQMYETMDAPGQLRTVAAGYDHVLIDTPGRIAEVTVAALSVADLAILPTNTGNLEQSALQKTLATFRDVQAARRRTTPSRPLRGAILLTRLDPGTVQEREAREAVDGAGVPVLRTQLSTRIEYLYALNEARMPRGEAALEVRSLVDELAAALRGTKGNDVRPAQSSAQAKPAIPGTRRTTARPRGAGYTAARATDPVSVSRWVG